MANSNGIITPPIGFADVQNVIGSASNDLGTLCRYGNGQGQGSGSTPGVNKWAKYKPIDLWKNPEPGVLLLNDALNPADNRATSAGTMRRRNLFGLKPSFTGFVSPGTTFGIDPESQLGLLLNQILSGGTASTWNWLYQIPHGGNSSIYRLSDFNSYSHRAQPVNPDYNQGCATILDVPVETYNTELAGSITVGLGWPGDSHSINWNEFLKALNLAASLSGEWRFAVEVYKETHFSPIPTFDSDASARYLGLRDGSGRQLEKTDYFYADDAVDVNGSPQFSEHSAKIDLAELQPTGAAMASYCLVMGYHYSEGPDTKGAILAPFYPIRRISVSSEFPYNVMCTMAGWWQNGSLVWSYTDRPQHPNDNCVGREISVQGPTIYFKFKVNPVAQPITITSANFSKLEAFGSYGSHQATSVTLCDASGATLQNDSVTFSTTSETEFMVKCENALAVGVSTSYTLYYKRDMGDAAFTPMAMPFVTFRLNSI